ncbi:MAG: hypothetical protein GF393_05955 [Armatimonadia bacterium]|nr:hypothetical protein [Armatimonadia bacterium]
MRAQRVAVVVALLVLSVPASFAQGWDGGGYLWDARTVQTMPTQSWFGGTGMIVIPTADTVPPQKLSAHFHAVDVDGKDDWEDVWGLTASIYPGLEAGITNLGEAFTGTGEDELVYQAKIGANLHDLLNLGEESPDIAIGGRDIADQVGEAYYVVFSKDFNIDEVDPGGNAINVSLGIGNADGDDVPLDGVFFGVDFTPFDFARMQVEHDGENVNASLRYWWSEWAVTEIGVLDGDLGAGASIYTGW